MTHADAVGLPLFVQVTDRGCVAYVPIPPSVPCATSEAAAGRVKAASQRDRILALLRAHPAGLTAAEVEAATGYSGTRARLLELSHGVGVQRGLGLIERTEEQRVVAGHSSAYIWRIR